MADADPPGRRAHDDDTTQVGVRPLPSGVDGPPCLIVINSSRAERIGRAMRLDTDGVVIGRGAEARLRIDDPGVSRQHVRIERLPDGRHAALDLGSTNGTFVNGQRIKTAVLNEGDRLQVGMVTAFRYTARDRLEDGEARLRQALAAAGVGTWEWQASSGAISLSDTAERLIWAENEPGPRQFWGVIHADDRPALRIGLAEAAASGAPCDLECRVRTPGGERWLSLRGEIFRDEEGRPLHLAGTLMDVTARKEVEQELRNQALLFDSLSDGVLVLDPDGRIADWSSGAQRMLGFDKNEALQRAPEELLRPELDGLRQRILDGIASAGRWSGELRVTRKNGDHCLVELTAVPLRDRTGAQVGHAAVLRDVGERRELEARLNLTERLGALGILSAGMAHEINNPLAFVTNNLEWIARRLEALAPQLGAEQADELVQALRETKSGAQRIASVVRDLRDFARGAERDTLGAVDPNRSLDFVLRIAENEIRHRAQLTRALAEVPPVRASEARLGQVLLSLVLHAAHSIPEGNAANHRIRVSTAWDAARGRVHVEVADTGPGMPEHERVHAFDPFSTIRPGLPGTGLGLAICHRVVSALGGDLSIDSRPGGGTRFLLSLVPAVIPDARPQAPAPSPTGPRAKILVVDDEPFVGEAVRRLLALDHDVSVAPSGAAALEQIRGGARFDAVLCDLMMPDLSGAELHAVLSREAPDLLPKLVFMTGGAFTEQAQAFLDGLQRPPLQKPFDRAELQAALAGALA